MNSAVVDLSFGLLRLGLETDEIDENFLAGFHRNTISNQEWEDIYNLGVRQGVAAIQFSGLQKLADAQIDLPFQLPDRKLKMKWFAHTIQVKSRCVSQLKTASELADIYAKNGIRTVVLKGISAGLNYPCPNLRPCGDLDCFLLGKYELGNVVAKETGATVVPNHYKHSQISYKGLTVENHRFCAPIRGDKRLKQFESLLQSLVYEEGTVKVEHTMLEVPSAMFNALFLTHHAQRHFLTEGIALRHLCDWAMLLNQHKDELDWRIFNNYCEKYGMNYFADTMTRVSAKYLGISIPKNYVLERDEYRDSTLIDYILHYSQHHENVNVWYCLIKFLMSFYKNRNRYKLYSDKSMISVLWNWVYGFCFDRHPKI